MKSDHGDLAHSANYAGENLPSECDGAYGTDQGGRADALSEFSRVLQQQASRVISSEVFQVPLPNGTMVSLPKLPMIAMCD